MKESWWVGYSFGTVGAQSRRWVLRGRWVLGVITFNSETSPGGLEEPNRFGMNRFAPSTGCLPLQSCGMNVEQSGSGKLSTVRESSSHGAHIRLQHSLKPKRSVFNCLYTSSGEKRKEKKKMKSFSCYLFLF